MWNKNEESGAAPKSGVAPKGQPDPPTRNVVSMPPPAPASTPAPTRGAAVIGASMQIQGEIRAREELLVEGDVEGLIESHSTVTIGPNGKVKANIRAKEVAIYGSARGNIEVTEKIAIRDKGSLIGDIKAAGISIDDGAYFKGSIDIVRPEPVRESKAPAVPARSGSAAGD